MKGRRTWNQDHHGTAQQCSPWRYFPSHWPGAKCTIAAFSPIPFSKWSLWDSYSNVRQLKDLWHKNVQESFRLAHTWAFYSRKTDLCWTRFSIFPDLAAVLFTTQVPSLCLSSPNAPACHKATLPKVLLPVLSHTRKNAEVWRKLGKHSYCQCLWNLWIGSSSLPFHLSPAKTFALKPRLSFQKLRSWRWESTEALLYGTPATAMPDITVAAFLPTHFLAWAKIWGSWVKNFNNFSIAGEARIHAAPVWVAEPPAVKSQMSFPLFGQRQVPHGAQANFMHGKL